MSNTPNPGLPLLAVGQASNETTNNEALDALVMPGVIDATTTAPPGSPVDGDVYLVAAGATGAWSGTDGQLAARCHRSARAGSAMAAPTASTSIRTAMSRSADPTRCSVQWRGFHSGRSNL